MREGILQRYRSALPITDQTPKLTLYEGQTPLVLAEKLSEELGVELYFKWEGANPTGSFKDRGMVLATAKAVEEGSRIVMCASTGNTSASAAAYAARLGIRCIVVVPHEGVAMGKLSQAIMYGAEILSVSGNFDQALHIVREITEEAPITLVNSVNPYRIEGQKTAAFEVNEQLGEAPDILAIPVGNAGNITAYWKGFQEHSTKKRPKMWGFEAEGSAAIVRNQVIEHPETVASAIRIGNPASWRQAVSAMEQSGGVIDAVNDEQILDAYQRIAQEGIFAEPGSAASVAGVMQKAKQGELSKGSKVVCVLTGNGLKDPHTALEVAQFEPKPIPCQQEEILQAIGWKRGVGV